MMPQMPTAEDIKLYFKHLRSQTIFFGGAVIVLRCIPYAISRANEMMSAHTL
jgi:hypothetical protein